MSGELRLNAIFKPKLENIDDVTKVLQLMWNHLPLDSINKATLSSPKRFWSCVNAGGEHDAEMNYLSVFVFIATANKNENHTLVLITARIFENMTKYFFKT